MAEREIYVSQQIMPDYIIISLLPTIITMTQSFDFLPPIYFPHALKIDNKIDPKNQRKSAYGGAKQH